MQVACAGIVLWAASAAADDLDLGGMVSTDFRVAVTGSDQGDLTWNINIGELNLKQRLNPHISYELDLRVMFDGLSFAENLHTLEDLTNSLSLDPFWIESDGAYVAIRDIFDGFDVVFGRQIVTWGASDRFRPTNNLNPDDLWDPTRFGMTQANEMIRFIYNPVGDLVLEAVVVPIFRPARLPSSAAAALADPNSVIPIIEDDVVKQIDDLHRMMTGLGFGFATTTTLSSPSVALENVQVGARMSWRTEETDWSLSFYRGFDDFPHPVTSVPTVKPGTDCQGQPVTGVGGCVDTVVGLAYPGIMVGGFDIAGQIPFLGDAGYRIEGAVVWPEQMGYVATVPAGFGEDIKGTVVDGRPFFKATLGIDYTFSRDVFALAMLVHGMVDELGPQFVGDYAVVGADFKFFNSKLLLRLFCIASFDVDHPAGVIYPLLNWNPWSSMELEAGALIFLGDDRSKFGQPAAGESTVFLRSRVRF
ncbi:MAG: hypothetical protein HY905_19430 [Deltaproteobacteria bacterium]|nr:hypothetical protein [Deltaproteobacteria bacterium]